MPDRPLAPGLLLIVLGAFCLPTAVAGQTVYRWVDADGVVHFSDQPPPEEAGKEVESMPLPSAPTVRSAPPPAPRPSDQAPAVTPAPASPAPRPAAQALDIREMSLADLDLRCDAAREKKIAPLREAAIAECQANRRNDPEWCVRFNADFGDGGRTVNGTIRPRMFDDLPECVDALNERNRRGR